MEGGVMDITVDQERTLACAGGDSRQVDEEGSCGIARLRCNKEQCVDGPLALEAFEAGMQIAPSLGGHCIRRRSNRGLNRREQCPPAPAVPWWLYRWQGDE